MVGESNPNGPKAGDRPLITECHKFGMGHQEETRCLEEIEPIPAAEMRRLLGELDQEAFNILY